jgi:hypothetical protein
MPDGRDDRLDRAGRAQVHPVLYGVVAEGEQFLHIIGDLRSGLGEIRAAVG